MKVVITPQEFRALLSPKLQELFDSLVNNMADYGIEKPQAEAMVASQLFFLVNRKGSQ
jgi:hypothetical protein